MRRPPFITLYHFQPLTNIQAFVCNLHMRWLSRIFNHNICVYQTATQRDLPPYWITIWLIDWLMVQCLFVCLMIWSSLKNIINRINCWFAPWSWPAQNCRDSVLEILLHFIKYRNTQLISWCIDFVETRNFRRVSDESAKALQRFTHQKFSWNFGILQGVNYLRFTMSLIRKLSFW